MRALLAGLLVLTLAAAPAEAAQVVLKDGRVVSGALEVDGAGLTVTGAGLTVTGADGKPQTLAFSQVQAVSLDDQPIAPVAKPAESKLLNNDWLVWTAVGANVVTMAVGLVMIYRAASGK